ncbi:MAG: PTS transporter subunit EIIA [Lachnospiraceae bacterium]|nr:PTS transporter subunit EIIA [Lachnospiraceae bacterium]
MKFTKLLSPQCIELHGKPASKTEVIRRLMDLLMKSGKISDRKAFEAAVFEREWQGSTGVGDGIGIPHGKSAGVRELVLSAMVIPGGTDFQAIDGMPVDLLFMIVAPDDGGDMHLHMLSRISSYLLQEEFTRSLRHAATAAEFLRIFEQVEEKEAITERKEKSPQTEVARVLAVTDCHMGLVHTCMAAESLRQKAYQMGIPFKVETNGIGMVRNRLTQKEIQACDGIILATDVPLDLRRFEGKNLLRTSSVQAIGQPEALLRGILDWKTSAHRGEYRRNIPYYKEKK